MTLGIYLLSVPIAERDQFFGTLAHNLSPEQLPFVLKVKVDKVTCQLVLFDEQLTLLKLIVPSLVATRLPIENENYIRHNDSDGGEEEI